MATIKLVEDYAITSARRDVRDALTLEGEQAILLQLFHAEDVDAIPCVECGDDIYNSAERECTVCYGTMFEGAVRSANKIWALFGDSTANESLTARGVYTPDNRSVQFEAFPTVGEHDILVRIAQWEGGQPVKVYGYYSLEQVIQRSLRTGSRFGQANWDLIGQKATVDELPPQHRGILNYPIAGRQFFEGVQLIPATPLQPAQAVLQPDTRVIYFPFEAAPGGVTPVLPGGGMTFVQSFPASTWTIHHTLGYEPAVSTIVDGEEVEAEVDYPDNATVVITFNSPQAGIARLT